MKRIFCEVVLLFRNRLATGVLAITTYFHHVRLHGLFAVLAAILAVLFRRAIAGWMRAFVFRIFSHKTTLLSELVGTFRVILELQVSVVKDRMSFNLRSRAQHDRSLHLAQFQHHGFVQLNRVLLAVYADDQIQT